MAELKHIRDLPGWGKGDAALYTLDGDHIVISTIGEIENSSKNSTEAMFVGLAGAFGGYAVSGEETMAFRTDKNGKVSDWGEIAVATGEGSRAELIEELEER